MKNKELTFTTEEVKKMIMEAFIKGEDWGVAYNGWFSPSRDVRASRAAKDCEEVYIKALMSKL